MSEQPRRWRLDLVGYGVGVACVAIVAFFLFASPTAHFSTGTGPSLAASCLSPAASASLLASAPAASSCSSRPWGLAGAGREAEKQAAVKAGG